MPMEKIYISNLAIIVIHSDNCVPHFQADAVLLLFAVVLLLYVKQLSTQEYVTAIWWLVCVWYGMQYTTGLGKVWDVIVYTVRYEMQQSGLGMVQDMIYS